MDEFSVGHLVSPLPAGRPQKKSIALLAMPGNAGSHVSL
jgi:hypothetical protein